MTLTQKFAAFKTFIAQAWALTKPYFSSEQKWRARALLAAIVALNLGPVSYTHLDVYKRQARATSAQC